MDAPATHFRYSAALATVERTRWAMTPEALRGVLVALDRGLTAEHRPHFHASATGTREAIAADLGNPVEGLNYSYKQGSTGIMFLDGPIIPRADMFSDISGVTSIDNLTSDLCALMDDPTVDNIVLMVDSPGGSITGVSEFAQMLAKCGDKKSTTAYVYGMAGSAAYWIASAAGSIVAVDTGEVGSIGVVTTYRDTSKADAAAGIETIELVSSQSPYKRPNMATDDGKASVQTVLDDLASVFVDTVAANRSTTSDAVLKDFGQGGMMVASRALSTGMIDSIGTLDSILKTSASTSMPMNAKPTQPMQMGAIVNAEEMIKTHPEAAVALQEMGAVGERSRIQAIEGLMAKVEGAPAPVTAAALSMVNSRKFDPKATAENLALDLLSTVSKAQAEVVTAAAAGPRALGTTLAKVAEPAAVGTTAEEKDKAEADTIAGLSAAIKAENKQ